MVRKLLSIFVALFMALSAMAIDINYTVDIPEGITLGEVYENLKFDNDTLGEVAAISLFELDFSSWIASDVSPNTVCSPKMNDNYYLTLWVSLNDMNFNFFYQNCGDANISINGVAANVRAAGLWLQIYVPFNVIPTPPVSADFSITALNEDCGGVEVSDVLKDVKVPSDEELEVAGLKFRELLISDDSDFPQANPLNGTIEIIPGNTYYFVAMFDRTEVIDDMSNITMKVNDKLVEGDGNNSVYFYIYEFKVPSVSVDFSITALNEDCGGMEVSDVLKDVKVPSDEELGVAGLKFSELLISDNSESPQANPLNDTIEFTPGKTYYFVAMFDRTEVLDMSNVSMKVNEKDAKGDGNNSVYYFVYEFTARGEIITSVSPAPMAAPMTVVYAEGGKIDCTGEVTKIYDVNGLDVTASNGSLPAGVYIVACDGVRSKVIMQ